MDRTTTRKDIPVTAHLDQDTNEALDTLCRLLGITHSEALRLGARNLCIQHGIRTRTGRAVPTHPHIIQEAAS